MIYYFSGTGNSKWVAERLASETSDVAVDLIGASVIPPIDNQTVGIIFPVHAWGVPEPVLAFVKKLVGRPAFTYSVCTCGDEAGESMEKLNAIFHLDSMYSIAMPSNYIMGADVEPVDQIASKIVKAEEKFQTIAAQVITRQSTRDVNKGRLSWVKSNLANFGFNRFARSTKPFHVTDRCSSCGLCAEICPTNTIKLVDGKPQWHGNCCQCTACINRCPERAIEYGKSTAQRGRYQVEDYL